MEKIDPYEKHIPKDSYKFIVETNTKDDITNWKAVVEDCKPFFIGKKMNLSHVKEGGVCRYPKQKGIFIVSSRWPDDRTSGGTVVTHEDGSHEQHIWEHSDPIVVYLGDGKLKVSIELNKPQ
jgi:hypothetical protein